MVWGFGSSSKSSSKSSSEFTMIQDDNVELLQKLIEKDDTKFKTEFEEKLRIFKKKKVGIHF